MIGRLGSNGQWCGRRFRMMAGMFRLMAGLVILALFAEQTAMAEGPQILAQGDVAASAPAVPASQAPVQAAAGQTITVASGTSIPLTLVSPIKSKSTKVGDTVRAVVAFPIAVGTQVAIPAGTYVEGTVTLLTMQAKGTRLPAVAIHFTRLLYANGYTATLDAANTQARMESPKLPGAAGPEDVSQAAALANSPAAPMSYAVAPMSYAAAHGRVAFYGGEGFASRAQFGTTTTPTVQEPKVGPSVGTVLGITFGALAAVLVTLFLLGHHYKTNTDFLLFDAGWQFQMALTSPLVVDAGEVTAAAATPTR